MATLDVNWRNIHLTLNGAETEDVESAADVGAKITAYVSDALAKIPGLRIPLSLLAGLFTAFLLPAERVDHRLAAFACWKIHGCND